MSVKNVNLEALQAKFPQHNAFFLPAFIFILSPPYSAFDQPWISFSEPENSLIRPQESARQTRAISSSAFFFLQLVRTGSHLRTSKPIRFSYFEDQSLLIIFLSFRAKWILGSMLATALPFWNRSSKSLLRLEGKIKILTLLSKER